MTQFASKCFTQLGEKTRKTNGQVFKVIDLSVGRPSASVKVLKFQIVENVMEQEPFKTKRVLIADEQAHSRELLRILLEHEGCEVSEASDGVEAVEIARATLPDMVLLDLELPSLDAFMAAGELRLHHRPIVAMTGSSRSSDEHGLEEAGFTGHITKPVVMRGFGLQLAELFHSR